VDEAFRGTGFIRWRCCGQAETRGWQRRNRRTEGFRAPARSQTISDRCLIDEHDWNAVTWDQSRGTVRGAAEGCVIAKALPLFASLQPCLHPGHPAARCQLLQGRLPGNRGCGSVAEPGPWTPSLKSRSAVTYFNPLRQCRPALAASVPNVCRQPPERERRGREPGRLLRRRPLEILRPCQARRATRRSRHRW